MTKVLLIIIYGSFNQRGVTSQPVESMELCNKLADEVSMRRSLSAICVEAAA